MPGYATQDELADLRAEVAHLRALLVDATTRVPPASASAPAEAPRMGGGEPRLHRRGVLALLPSAAAGLAVAGATAGATAGIGLAAAAPAAAAAGAPLVLGVFNDAGDAVTTLTSTAAIAVDVQGTVAADGLHADNATDGSTLSWSLDVSDVTDAVFTLQQTEEGGAPVFATQLMSLSSQLLGPTLSVALLDRPGAVPGRADLPAVDVTAEAVLIGVRSVSTAGAALRAANTDPTATLDTATVTNVGHGHAIGARTTNTGATAATVSGINAGSGPGVWGTQAHAGSPEAGVVGQGGASGRGGRFTGGAAAVQLQASARPNHPAAGRVGDLMVDARGRLWFCRGGAGWKQLA